MVCTSRSNIEVWNQKIEISNLEKFCEECDIIIEAVDKIESKASILSWFEKHVEAPWLVTASGVAGLGPARDDCRSPSGAGSFENTEGALPCVNHKALRRKVS